MRLLIVIAVLLLPILTLAIKIRFALIRDEATKLDVLQKWGGD